MKIMLCEFNSDVLYNGSELEIEQELYPSGMELPTKYFSMSHLVSKSGTVEVKSIYEPIFIAYLGNGTDYQLTYPEYCALHTYATLLLCSLTDTDNSIGFNNILDNSSLALEGKINNAYIKDIDKFRNAIQSSYEELHFDYDTMKNNLNDYSDELLYSLNFQNSLGIGFSPTDIIASNDSSGNFTFKSDSEPITDVNDSKFYLYDEESPEDRPFYMEFTAAPTKGIEHSMGYRDVITLLSVIFILSVLVAKLISDFIKHRDKRW